VSATLALRVLPQLETGPAPASATRLSWLVANVHTENRRHEPLLALIRQTDPDIVGLLETDSRWLRALDRPMRRYTQRLLRPRPDNFGIALYSRYPLDRLAEEELGCTLAIDASLTLNATPVELLLIHPLPPISGQWAELRDAQLRRTARRRPSVGGGLVVAGDFNATP